MTEHRHEKAVKVQLLLLLLMPRVADLLASITNTLVQILNLVWSQWMACSKIGLCRMGFFLPVPVPVFWREKPAIPVPVFTIFQFSVVISRTYENRELENLKSAALVSSNFD